MERSALSGGRACPGVSGVVARTGAGCLGSGKQRQNTPSSRGGWVLAGGAQSFPTPPPWIALANHLHSYFDPLNVLRRNGLYLMLQKNMDKKRRGQMRHKKRRGRMRAQYKYKLLTRKPVWGKPGGRTSSWVPRSARSSDPSGESWAYGAGALPVPTILSVGTRNYRIDKHLYGDVKEVR